MAPTGSRKEKGNATARVKMPTSVINRRLSLDRDRIQGFIPEHIRGLIRIYNVCGVKDDKAWDLFYDIIFLNPVTTHHFYNSSWCGRTAGAGVHLFGSGGQPSAHIWGKCLTKPAIKWTIGGGTTLISLRIKSMAPIRRQQARGRSNAPASISLGTVAMISRQGFSSQAAGSTSQATSWPLDHWIGMR